MKRNIDVGMVANNSLVKAEFDWVELSWADYGESLRSIVNQVCRRAKESGIWHTWEWSGDREVFRIIAVPAQAEQVLAKCRKGERVELLAPPVDEGETAFFLWTRLVFTIKDAAKAESETAGRQLFAWEPKDFRNERRFVVGRMGRVQKQAA